MTILQTSLFAIAISYCLLSAAGLRNLLPQWRLRYFAFFLLLEATGFGFEWLMLNPETGFKSLWLGALMLLSLMIAPCLWLCTQEITRQKTPQIHTLPNLHKWLLATASLCVTPLLLSAHSGTQFGNPVAPVSMFHSVLIHGGMLICIGIFTLQVPMIAVRIRLLLQKYEAQIADQFSDMHAHSLRALNWLLLILLVKWLMVILRTLHCMYIGPVGGIGINLFMTIEILFNLRALFALSRLSPSPAGKSTDQKVPVQTGLGNTEKYANSPLDENIRSRIQAKLRDAMAEKHLYAQPSLSLRQLSEMFNESPHYLSQVINQDLNSSFYEWVNSHRIEAAKRALLSQPDKNILSIAEDVGFNSKSTFNTAFRQLTQMTPSEYRRQNPPITSE